MKYLEKYLDGRMPLQKCSIIKSLDKRVLASPSKDETPKPWTLGDFIERIADNAAWQMTAEPDAAATKYRMGRVLGVLERGVWQMNRLHMTLHALLGDDDFKGVSAYNEWFAARDPWGKNRPPLDSVPATSEVAKAIANKYANRKLAYKLRNGSEYFPVSKAVYDYYQYVKSIH